MKKICFIFLILFLSFNTAQAYVETNDMTSEQFIKNQGYSPEVSRLIEIKTRPDEPRVKNSFWDKNRFLHYMKKTYIYLDPYADSDEFGEDVIKFYPTPDEI